MSDPAAVIAREVADVYAWIERQMASPTGESPCRACGRCCDFAAYDHRLYVTTPELVYLLHHTPEDGIRLMPADTCPYNEAGRCAIHTHRFAGCRIFFCNGQISAEGQGEVMEEAIRRFKDVCRRFNLPYRYCDLKTALTQTDDLVRRPAER